MCHEINERCQIATLDHFFWNHDLEEKVMDAGVIHSPDNFSDHCPIYCIINCDIPGSTQNIQNGAPPKPKWKKATREEKEAFVEHLDEQLQLLDIPESVLTCTDVHCKDETHRADSDIFMTAILDTIDATAYNCLPVSNPHSERSRSKKIVPGLSEFVKPFRDKAFFWSQVWKSAGRPLNCQLHSIMKRSRNLYHFHVRKNKKSEDIIKKNKLLDACINGNGDVFAEIKKIRQHSPAVATTMDGVKDDIPNHFKGIFEICTTL